MRNTIKAKDGYRIMKIRHIETGETATGIYDGDNLILVVEKRSWEDYIDEREGNECFKLCEVFTTVKGNQYIYWMDIEIDADYITRVNH